MATNKPAGDNALEEALPTPTQLRSKVGGVRREKAG
jgi:hypothetical protein